MGSARLLNRTVPRSERAEATMVEQWSAGVVKTVQVGQMGLGPVVIVVKPSHSVRKGSGGVIGCVFTDLFVGVCFSSYLITVGASRPSDPKVFQAEEEGAGVLMV